MVFVKNNGGIGLTAKKILSTGSKTTPIIGGVLLCIK